MKSEDEEGDDDDDDDGRWETTSFVKSPVGAFGFFFRNLLFRRIHREEMVRDPDSGEAMGGGWMRRRPLDAQHVSFHHLRAWTASSSLFIEKTREGICFW